MSSSSINAAPSSSSSSSSAAAAAPAASPSPNSASPSDSTDDDECGSTDDDEVDVDEAIQRAKTSREAKHNGANGNGNGSTTGGEKKRKKKAPLEDTDPSVVYSAEWGGWTESDWTAISVRGGSYSADHIKIPAGPHMFRCEHLHVIKTKADRIRHVSERTNSYANARYNRIINERRAAAAAADGGNGGSGPVNLSLSSCPADILNPLIVINFLVPLSASENCNLILYFTRRRRSPESQTPSYRERGATANFLSADPQSDRRLSSSPVPSSSPAPTGSPAASPTAASSSSSSSSSTSAVVSAATIGVSRASVVAGSSHWSDRARLSAFDRLLRDFLQGSDDYRNHRLKVIPKVVDGPWITRKVVNGTPALLGQKITQHYNVDVEKNYIEISVDLNSSVVAGKILQLVNGQAQHLVVDVSFLLQGENDNELPESLLGGVRLIHLKLDKFRHIGEVNI